MTTSSLSDDCLNGQLWWNRSVSASNTTTSSYSSSFFASSSSFSSAAASDEPQWSCHPNNLIDNNNNNRRPLRLSRNSDWFRSLSSRWTVSATRLQHHQQHHQQQQHYQLRYKHSGRMGHKLDKLEELAHRPEREAAEERRQKKKERKAAKKNKKGGGHGDLDEEGDDKSSVVSAVMDGHDDHDDWWLDDGNDDDDNNNNSDDGDAAAQPSLPDPNQVKARMMAVVTRFQESLKTISGAKPSPEMFDDVQVNAYGSMTPLKAVGQVVITSPTLAQITCFDPSMAKDVQKAVQLTLELNPQLEEGGLLRVPLPRLSMEVREQNAKKLQKTAESCKQRIRQVRRKAMDTVKRGKDGKLDGISKDDAFANGKEIDAVTEAVMDVLKTIVDEKMRSIMEV